MTRTLSLLAALAALMIAGCGDTGGDTGGDADADRPGNPKVYQRIAKMQSCVKLQHEFDTAMDNVERYPGGDPKREAPMAYADAAMARMDEVGCS